MKQIISLLAIVLLASSCKKEQAGPPPAAQPGKKLVAYKYQEYPSSDLTFGYNSDGILVSEENSTHRYSYTYQNGGCIYEDFWKTQNRLIVKNEFVLNNAGRATTSVETTYDSPNNIYTCDNVYEYDASGKITSWKYKYSNSPDQFESKFVNTNGNTTELTRLKNGNVVAVYKYTYTNIPDKVNVDLLGNIYFSDRVFGVGNKNLRATVTSFSPNNVKTGEGTYTYELDAEGYPVKLTFHNLTTNQDSHNSFLYDK